MYIFSVIVLPIVYGYLFARKQNWLERLIIGTMLFWSANSIYFMLTYLMGIRLSAVFLLGVHVVCVLLQLFFYKRNFGFEFKQFHPSYHIVATFSTLLVLVLGAATFNNGFRLPLLSRTNDAAHHYRWVQEIFLHQRIEADYPLGFHGNSWLYIQALYEALQRSDADYVLTTNVYTAFVMLAALVIVDLSLMVSAQLFGAMKTKPSPTAMLLLSLLTFASTILITSINIYGGFYSNWFNLVFLLGLLLIHFKKIYSPLLLILVCLGFLYSYYFFVPVLLGYLAYAFYVSKNRTYLVVLLIVLLVSAGIGIRNFGLAQITLSVAAIKGYFPELNYSWVLVLLGLSSLSLLRWNLRFRQQYVQYLVVIYGFICFLVYLALMTIIGTGSIQYSFYKTFTSLALALSFSVIATLTYYFQQWSDTYENQELHRIAPLVVLSFGLLFVLFSNPKLNLYDIRTGSSNFLTNDHEKYNALIYTLEHQRNFQHYLYLDNDDESWYMGTVGLLSAKLPVVRKADMFDPSLDYFVDELQRINNQESVLIVAPNYYMEKLCDDDRILNLVKNSGGKYQLYPEFDASARSRLCTQ